MCYVSATVDPTLHLAAACHLFAGATVEGLLLFSFPSAGRAFELEFRRGIAYATEVATLPDVNEAGALDRYNVAVEAEVG